MPDSPKAKIENTRILFDLFETPSSHRDKVWEQRFFDVVVDAALNISRREFIEGPDHFDYLPLELPLSGESFSPYSIFDVLDLCLEGGAGITIHSGAAKPEWVFSYGNLWSLKAYGTFDTSSDTWRSKDDRGSDMLVTPQGVVVSLEELKAEQEVGLAKPSDTYLPPFARQALRWELQRLKIFRDRVPRVIVVTDQKSEPTASLAFNLYLSDFDGDMQIFSTVLARLRWYLPHHYGLVGLPEGEEFTESPMLTPL